MSPFDFATLVVVDDTDRVEVRLNRPEKRNAINKQMVDELNALLDDLEANPTRVLILTGGEDGVFAAGADIAELYERRRDDALAAINLSLFERIRRYPLPTIAAVDGHALGGGAELAYACDLRVASDRAAFGQPETRLGIMAAAGGCYRLAQLVGESLATEMLFTGRRLRGEDALAAGLVSRVVVASELLATARELTDEIVKSSPLALRLTKLALHAPSTAHPAVDILSQALLFEDDEKMTRMREFLERR